MRSATGILSYITKWVHMHFLSSAEQQMNQVLLNFQKDFAAVRTGRANAAILDHVEAIYYGVPTPLNQLAQISVSDARILTIKPFDKSASKEIEKSILSLGHDVFSDGNVMKILIPEPIERKPGAEIRKKLAAKAQNEILLIVSRTISSAQNSEEDLSSIRNALDEMSKKYISKINQNQGPDDDDGAAPSFVRR